MSAIPTLLNARDLLQGYDVIFCDIWGVVHNGQTAYEAGCSALTNFRLSGGTVILVSNAPRQARTVASILDSKHVPRECWDAIVPSGDLALDRARATNVSRVHHLGPDRDLDLFDDTPLRRVSLDDSEAILCTGLVHDRTEQPDDYRTILTEAASKQLPLICANPDLVVDVGGDLLHCAGSLAAIYENIGGSVYWAGKPFAAAYERATRHAEQHRSSAIDKSHILAIGDAVRTDIAGANFFGIDALFIGQGIHRDTVMPSGEIDTEALKELFDTPQTDRITKTIVAPQAVGAMSSLAW